MPRKKTIQPAPIESFTLDDGTIVEIRCKECRVIGRGLHKTDKYEEKRDVVFEKVVADYLTSNGKKLIPKEKDYLSSAAKFTRQAEQWGMGDINGADNSALRKKLYRDIVKHITALENAIKNKNQ